MSYEMMEEDFKVHVRADGDNTNGGMFAYNASSAGVDRSNQADAYVDFSSGSSSGVTATTQTGDNWYNRRRIVLSGYTVSNDDIGNVVQLDSDSGSSVYEGMHRITSVDVTGNYWQTVRDVRSSAGDSASETVTGKMGGALADPFFYRSKMHVFYNRGYMFLVYLKAATYTCTSGNELDSSAITYMPYGEKWVGYTTTPGDHNDGGARPIIDVPSSLNYSGTVLDLPNSWSSSATFLEVRGGGKATKGIHIGNYANTAYLCVVKDCGGTGSGYPTGFYGTGLAIACHAEDCVYGYFYNIISKDCSAKDCTYGWSLSYSKDICINCIADTCSTAGILAAGDSCNTINTVAYNCSNVGIELTNRAQAIGCGAHSCGKGFSIDSYAGAVIDSWVYNNTTNFYAGADNYQNINCQTLTADPFESSTDFRLNDAAAGGALLAGKGAAFGAGTQTSYSDINAFTTEPAGSSSTTVVTPGPVQKGM